MGRPEHKSTGTQVKDENMAPFWGRAVWGRAEKGQAALSGVMSVESGVSLSGTSPGPSPQGRQKKEWYMKSIISILITAVIIGSYPQACLAADAELDALIKECEIVFKESAEVPEGMPQRLLKNATAIAIFPSTIKGAFFVGARYGEGVVIHRDEESGKWSPPAFFTVSGASFGWQVGGQAIDLIFVIPTERGFEGMLQNKLNVGNNTALVIGPVGRNAELGADITLKGGIFTYSRAKGLFAGIGLKGVAINFNKEANKAYYGEVMTARDILLENKAGLSDPAKSLIDTVAEFTK